MRLSRLLALALDLPSDYFVPFFKPEPYVTLRPLHYQGRVSAPEDGVFGAGASPVFLNYGDADTVLVLQKGSC